MRKRLAKAITANPNIVVGMFLISAVSGLMGIIVGWDVFYRDYLSKTATIPIWALILGAFLIFAVNMFSKGGKGKKTSDILEVVEGKKFGVQSVVIDGRDFKRCEFQGTELVFKGEAPFGLSSCSLSDIYITFQDSAGLTVQALSILAADPGLKQLSDGLIAGIQNGTIGPRAPVHEYD